MNKEFLPVNSNHIFSNLIENFDFCRLMSNEQICDPCSLNSSQQNAKFSIRLDKVVVAMVPKTENVI